MYHTFIISQTVFQDFNKIHVDNKTKSSYAYQELSLAKLIFFFLIQNKVPTLTRMVGVEEESVVFMRQ